MAEKIISNLKQLKLMTNKRGYKPSGETLSPRDKLRGKKAPKIVWIATHGAEMPFLDQNDCNRAD